MTRQLAVLAWSALWVSLGGNPDRIVLPPDDWVMPNQPSEAVSQIRSMIAKTDGIYAAFDDDQGNS